MKTFFSFVAAAALTMGAAMGGGLPQSKIIGEYVEARTADVFTGPCFANSEVELTGDLAVMGWKISKGSFQGVNLDGLAVVGVVKANATLGDLFHTSYPVKSVLIVDEKATPEQRLALKGLAQRMAGDLLSDIVRIEYAPVTLTFANGDMHSSKAELKAGSLAAITTRAIKEGDHLCSNELVWYTPLSKTDHAMPAYALAHSYSGKGLNTTWSYPEKRSAFVGSFSYND